MMPTSPRLARRLARAMLALCAFVSLGAFAQAPSATPPRRPGAALAAPTAAPTPPTALAPAAHALPPPPAHRPVSADTPQPAPDASAAPTDAPAAPDADAAGTPPAAAQPAPPVIARDELAAFVDGIVRAYVEQKGSAGIVVAVVDRNDVLLARGYGDASIDPARAVDPATTLFRVGSISKTFTHVAAMQLAANGQLKLDAEANDYLPDALKIPDAGFEPVRVWHLMTHTAGFEETVLGHLFRRSPEGVPTLEAYLARYRPHRVRPPGQHAVYSNYGVALLGAIVARVSGEPFERYVEQHILAPAGMHHTTFREPLAAGDDRRVDAALIPDFSTGYERASGGYSARPFEFVASGAPAGAASASAGDMARWMRVLLGAGAIDGKTILAPNAFAELATVSFRNAPDVGAIAHGFFRERYGRYESLEHGGDTLWFHSNLVVLPEAGLGVFVASNTDSGVDLASTLPRLVFERFLPDARPAPTPAPAKDFATTGQRFAGTYMSERRNYSTFEKLFTGLNAMTTVSATSDGYLIVAGDPPRRYVQDGDLSFRATEGNARLDFLANAAGDVVGFANAFGHSVSDRVRWFDQAGTLGFVAGAVAISAILIVLGAWHRRRLPARVAARDGRLATGVLTFTALAWIALVALAGVAIGEVASGTEIVFAYPTPLLRASVAGAYACSALSLLSALLLVTVWGARDWGLARKFRHTVAVLLMLALVALFVRWNVLFAPLATGV